jgi:ATP-binding cassette subfamily F protein 2
MGKKNKKQIEIIEEEPEEEESVESSATVNELDEDDVHITATGNLTSHINSPDLKFDHFSVSINQEELIDDTQLCLNRGQRYGFIGLNGTGKSTMLKCLGRRLVPIPEKIRIFYLEKEAEPTEKSALDYVLEKIDTEREQLNEELDDPDTTHERQEEVLEKLDELDPEYSRTRAGKILHGLGFTAEMQQKQTKDFSGGWRMRIGLAEALLVEPDLLLLDEPTNHLDVETCIWLERYLKEWSNSLVLISHSQDFLNQVCTSMIHLKDKKLSYYGGNYETYVKTREDLEVNQMKKFNKEQEDIAHMKDYIARFGHGSAKLARQAKSKEKTLARMVNAGLTEKVTQDRIIQFNFPPCGTLPPPVLQVSQVTFGYPPKDGNPAKLLFKELSLGMDLESRIALVGPNGAGKSTLLKLLARVLKPMSGQVSHHSHLKIGYYHQHLADILDLDMTPLDWMFQQFPDDYENNSSGIEKMRSAIGRYGISGKRQTNPIRTLSDGLKSRLIFAWLSFKGPHMLLLDEPTNHLDLETIDALADAINTWDGGLVLVSHDFRLIDQVAKEIWEVDHGKINIFKGDIQAYKRELQRNLRD